MKSKDAMLALYTFVALQVPKEKMKEWTEALDSIKADLDALEVLKKHAKCEPMIPGEKEPDIVITIQCEADEEYKAVEEWLKEEPK